MPTSSLSVRVTPGSRRPIISPEADWRRSCVEANHPGWGASGRNGGVITAKFRQSFRDIDAAHGRGMAKRMYEIAHESVEIVEELVSEFGITAARLRRNGQIKAAHNVPTFEAAVAEAEWMKREMGDSDVRILDIYQVYEETGSKAFVGGVLNPGSGGIHPLNYLRGLAEGLAQRGVAIFQETPCCSEYRGTTVLSSSRRPKARFGRSR